jgi:integrase
LEKYIAQRKGEIKPRSIELLEQTKGRLIAAFGAATPLDRITPDHAADWRAAMLGNGLSEATVRLHTRNAKAVFNDAVDRELLDRNPFRKLPSAAVAADRGHYVSLADAEQVLAHLPDHEHRLLFGLARFAGLRVPSESHLLEWGALDWRTRRLTVFAPKTGATRTVPVVPRLWALLEEAHAQREAGFEQMLLITTNNLHRTLHAAIKAAGSEPWPDLFQALRRSAETDFAGRFPAHVAAAWLGHSVAVGARHYLQVPDSMLDAAVGAAPDSALHLALQHGAELGRTGPQNGKRKKAASSASAA